MSGVGPVPSRSEGVDYYEMDTAIYGVRNGVVFTLNRSCEWERMSEGSQLHMPETLRMRATRAKYFDQIRQYVESSREVYRGEVKPL